MSRKATPALETKASRSGGERSNGPPADQARSAEGHEDGFNAPVEAEDAPHSSDGQRDAQTNLSYQLEINTSLKRELKEYRSQIRTYSLTIKELQSQLDRTISELRACEEQIDELRADYVELKAARSAELKQAILSVQSQLSRTLEDFSRQQLWLASLCRRPERRLDDLKRAFNADEYLSNNRDIHEAYYLGRISSPFDHWMACGAAEGRKATFKHGPSKER
jgi:DNA repair exonuclease SbcCD ATPase subunit